MPSLHPFVLTVLRKPETIAGSLLIAVMATYLALEFAGRMRRETDKVSMRLWTGAGSITLGSGIWAMHFVGMSAATYPFVATYGELITALSWLAAVGIAAVVLATAVRKTPRRSMVTMVAVLGGVAATTMHFIGQAAMNVAPAPAVRFDLAGVAAATAACGIAAALALFHRLEPLSGRRRVGLQCVAAAVLGGALTAMHYLAMAATSFADGSICTSRAGLDVDAVGNTVEFATVACLSLIFVVTLLERRASDRARQINGSLARVREQLQFVTFNDPATGLPNRLVFDDRMQQAAARCDRSGEALAVLFVGLDAAVDGGLALGSPTDEAVRRLAARLQDVARAADTIASVGAGQFLVMVSGGDPAGLALQIAERIRAVPRGNARPPNPATSIGIALYPRDGAYAEIVRNANAALVAAQRDGGNGFRFFEASIEHEARLRSAWLDDLRKAVRAGELELHYQPKVHARSGTIAGVEALLRWRHPVRGMVSPVVFIPIAEQHGLIDEIGGWVVREACRQMRCWLDVGLRVRVAINVSPRQLRRPELAGEILEALACRHIDPSLLTCEVTETGAMSDPAASGDIFERLCAAGVHISIDDFGTGYSSLSQLRRMPVRQLKIDRSFVNDLEHSEDARAIVAAVVQMAHILRLEVVAEGVETEGQRRILLGSGCDKMQGYLFARPMSADRLTEQLQDRAQPTFNASNVMAA